MLWARTDKKYAHVFSALHTFTKRYVYVSLSNKKPRWGCLVEKQYCARKKEHNLNLKKLIVQLFEEWNGRNEAAKDCSTQHSRGIYFSKVHVVAAAEPETSVNYSVTSHR